MKKYFKIKFKQLTKSALFIKLITFIIAQYLKLTFYTIKWQNDAEQLLAEYHNQSVILVFWHGRMLMMTKLWPNPQNLNVLISHHSDGEIIAKTIEHMNFKTIRGSTNKGGLSALKQILRILKTESIAITPDGPRGPVFKISGHLYDIAVMSKCPIVFACYATEEAKILNSWDKMIIPKMFSKGYFVTSEPIICDENINQEYLEQKFIELTQQVDAMAGLKVMK